MNKNAIGLHKFSRIFFGGDDARSSTRPVQIATGVSTFTVSASLFASTRSVQIATKRVLSVSGRVFLCLHTLRADCNFTTAELIDEVLLCLHTPRADCNMEEFVDVGISKIFASTRPVQIATKAIRNFGETVSSLPPHAPCRLQLLLLHPVEGCRFLCLHTPRADCNGRNAQNCNMHFSERVLSW